jgi:hypothetical protein
MNSSEDRRPSDASFEPIAKAEDVEFSEALADEEDREAQRRAAEADARAEQYEGERP